MAAPRPPRYGVVLGGGRSRRMGTDKLALTLNGRALLELVVDAVAAWADLVVVAGPERTGSELPNADVTSAASADPGAGFLNASPEVASRQRPDADPQVADRPRSDDPATPQHRPRVIHRQEDPPFGGPVAGLSAALAALPTSDPDGHDANQPDPEVIVLAGDLIAPEQIVTQLAAAELGPDGVALIDPEGWPQYLAARYRLAALRATLANAPQLRDISVTRVCRQMNLALIEADAQLVHDIDTPDEARRAGLVQGRE